MKLPLLLPLMLMISLLIPGQGEVRPSGKSSGENAVKTHYSESTDTTEVFVDLGLLPLTPSHRIESLRVQLAAYYKGKDKTKPERARLILSATPRWSFSDEQRPHLLILADGVMFDAGEPDTGTHYSVSASHELMHFALPCDQFLKVAEAQAVELQLDGVTFDLTQAQLERLREFAKGL